MASRRGRGWIGGLALLILTLFAGHWVAQFLSDQWWAAAVDPAAAPFLMRWHLLGLLLDLGGITVAALWCVVQLLFVVGSISTVQVPRRLGDLEIRELLPHAQLRAGAILAGLLLGGLVGSGADRALPLVLQGWHGVRYGVADPVLGIDAGVYLAQLPLWLAGLAFCRRLVWVALGGAALCHFLLGGVRVSRAGIAMTDAARIQLGLLVALTLGLAALGEGIGPLRAVAGLDTGSLAGLAPATRWGVAVLWGVAAVAVALWTLRPWPGLLLFGVGLWLTSGLLSRVLAGHGLGDGVPADQVRAVAAVATGLESLREESVPPGSDGDGGPSVGIWGAEAVAHLMEVDHGEILALAPLLLPHGATRVPTWLALRDGRHGTDLVAIADDRLAPGGAPVTFRDQDGADYPGVVSWRRLDPLMTAPGRADTIAAGGAGGVVLGGGVRKLLLAWGTQSPGLLNTEVTGGSLFWRRGPAERVAHLFPVAWWSGVRPLLISGDLYWVVEGWLVGDGAPLAPAIPWEGTARRYLRPAFVGVVAAADGRTRIYLRSDADPLAATWAIASAGAIAPAESLPPEVDALPRSSLDLAVKGYALLHGAFGFRHDAIPAADDSLLPLPTTIWTAAGPTPELALAGGSATDRAARLDALLIGGVGKSVRLLRWGAGGAPRRPRALESDWQRFASFERLQDSITTGGGQLLPGPLRYEVGPRGTIAVQALYAVSATGTVTLAWVQVARGDRLGAARTLAAAWANLEGESAPLVPAPDLPDPLVEARRWAARADSLLRAGDLEGFARAFAALKRVLGTP